jgi:hypothetical protein
MSRFTAYMDESEESKLSAGHFVGAGVTLLVVAFSVGAYEVGKSAATREVESRINTEHQQAIEDAVVCKLSLALTQGRLQRFE